MATATAAKTKLKIFPLALVPMELKVGDRVVYGKYSGTQVELEGEEIILIKEADVIAKLG